LKIEAMGGFFRSGLLLVVLAGTSACSSAGSSSGSGSGEPVNIVEGRIGERLEDYAAEWEGYAEANSFADGSDKVRITLDASGDGTLEIGDSAPMPPATNPNVGYPLKSRPEVDIVIQLLFPGVSYPISAATVESARIRFWINPWDVERDWCALQTSFPVTGSVHSHLCVSASTGQRSFSTSTCYLNEGDSLVPVDCDKRNLCWSDACACDEAGCSRHEDTSGQHAGYTRLDAALDDTGNSLVGTLKINDTAMTVRLRRR
jgi:hypothetical protein